MSEQLSDALMPFSRAYLQRHGTGKTSAYATVTSRLLLTGQEHTMTEHNLMPEAQWPRAATLPTGDIQVLGLFLEIHIQKSKHAPARWLIRQVFQTQ